MRTFEGLIPILLVIYLIWPHPRKQAVHPVPALALVVTLLHFAVEGYRWQMIPLYALSPVIAITSLSKLHEVIDWKPFVSHAVAVLVVIFTALPMLLPVPNIPLPGGPYHVGTRLIELTDVSRKELYSGLDEPRHFLVQVWYPADTPGENNSAPWMMNAQIFAPAIADFLDLPPFFLDHLALVKIPANQDAPLASTNSGFPLILFSHGWNGFNAQNSRQALELASRGFIVAGIQHTYGAVTTVFSDGSIAPHNPDALLKDANDPNYEVTARVLADQWAGDLAYALDDFSHLNKETGGIFEGRLQMDKVGIYGHSTGGGAAIEFCARDMRCKAVLGMDPFMRPVSVPVLEEGVQQPSFFMFSQSWVEDVNSRNNQLFRQFLPHLSENYGVISISGTKHYDFSDLPLLSPIAPQLGLRGQLNGRRVTEVVNKYLIEFFDQALNGKPTDLFDEFPRDYPEVVPYPQGR